MEVIISQPMIGRTTEEISKEYREVVDWCEDKFNNQNDIKFINPLIPPLSPYRDELLRWLWKVKVAVFTKGWENERDCVIVYHICNNYGITIYELDDCELFCRKKRKETKHDECLYFTANGWVDQ